MQSLYQGFTFLWPVLLGLFVDGGRVGHRNSRCIPFSPQHSKASFSAVIIKSIKNKYCVDWPGVNHLLNWMQYLDYMSKPAGGIGAALLTPLNSMDLVGRGAGCSPRKIKVVSLGKEEHGCWAGSSSRSPEHFVSPSVSLRNYIRGKPFISLETKQ